MNDQLTAFASFDEHTRQLLIELGKLDYSPAKPKEKVPDVVASPVLVMLNICRCCKIAAGELKTARSTRQLSEARYIAYHLLNSNRASKTSIGRLFNRDRTTVCAGMNTHQELLFSNAQYRSKYNLVLDSIKQTIAAQEGARA